MDGNSDSIHSLPADGMLSSSPAPARHRLSLGDNDPHGGGDGAGTLAGPRRKRIKRTKIDHTYRDLSKMSLEAASKQLQAVEGGMVLPTAPPAVRNQGISFPSKLYEMVTNPEFQHIIAFMPHGRSWAVLNKELLASVVLPKYFNHSKFESFNRQVNGWGFKRLLKRGPDQKSYYHECFLRGRPELSTLMARLVSPGKRIPDRDGEPNFYDISAKAPLPEVSIVAPPLIETNQASAGARVAQSQVAVPRAKQEPAAEATNHNRVCQQYTTQYLPPSPPKQDTSSWFAESGINPWGGQASSQNMSDPSYQTSFNKLQMPVVEQDPRYNMATASDLQNYMAQNYMMFNIGNEITTNAFVSDQKVDVEANRVAACKLQSQKNMMSTADLNPSDKGRENEKMSARPDSPSSLFSNDSMVDLFHSQEFHEVGASFCLPCDQPNPLPEDGLKKMLVNSDADSTGETSVCLTCGQSDSVTEGGPENLSGSSDTGAADEMSSLSAMTNPDPLLEIFAHIYYSKGGSTDF